MKESKGLGIVLCCLVGLLVSPVDPAGQQQHQFCVIGAGPSGGGVGLGHEPTDNRVQAVKGHTYEPS